MSLEQNDEISDALLALSEALLDAGVTRAALVISFVHKDAPEIIESTNLVIGDDGLPLRATVHLESFDFAGLERPLDAPFPIDTSLS